jgi:hypothetical protein
MSNQFPDDFRYIADKLDKLRRGWSRFILIKGLVRGITLIMACLFILLTLEGMRYFNTSVRRDMLVCLAGFGGIFFLTPIIMSVMVRLNRVVSYSDFRLAKLIGKVYPEINDKLLNVLQLHKMSEKNATGYSQELANYSIHSFAESIQLYQFGDIIPWQKFKKSLWRYSLILGAVFIIFFSRYTFFKDSFIRLSHPNIEYSVPTPFFIQSLNGSFGVFGGDSVEVAFQCHGEYPGKIYFRAIYPDFTLDETAAVNDSGRATVQLGAVRNTIYYEAYVQNSSPFKPWRRISSGTDTVFVSNRPEIIDLKTRIEYPAYTQLKPKEQERNATEFTVLPGSDMQLKLLVNKPVTQAEIRFTSGKTISLKTNAETATGQFTALDNDEFRIIVADENNVQNSDPIRYRIRLIPDAYPGCQLISPNSDIELSEALEIPLGIRISDDFGFAKALIGYHLIKRYSPNEHIQDTVEFPLTNKRLTLQELYYVWDVGDLHLSPEDVIEFNVTVYDNDPINGPKSTTSRTLRARFPSLNDLFSEIHEDHDLITEESEDILKNLESTREIIDEISRELLKNSKMNWEQKQQLEKEVQKTKEAGEKLSKMADRLDEMIQKSRDNQLFDEETLNKYAKLQEAFQEIMTPELRAAMEKLQKALDDMDPQEIQKSLKQFRSTREQFAKELDRMIRLLERVKIEQSVSEIVRRFEDLLKRQESVNSELEKTKPGETTKFKQLAGEEKSIERDTKIAHDLMKRTSEDMQDFPLMPSEQLENLISDFEKSSLMDDIRQAQKMMNGAKKQQARQSANSSQKQLRKFYDKMEQFQADFNKKNMAEVMNDFSNVIYKTLQLSQNQERLSEEIRQTPRQSERLMDIAVNQQQLRQNLVKLIDDLISLSNKTFGLSTRVGKGFGQASAAMNNAVQQMEERNPGAASKSAQKATAALNQSALELINSMQNLQSSGSASGFENYLQQLQNMAGQQQGINEETQMLGIGKAGQQAAMQRMAARQQQLRKSLEQLRSEIGEGSQKSGDLGGIAKDMDEVIKDLQQNRILRKTLERQQRILSRLLDAQKSLRTQDFKKERKSKTADDFIRESPGQLPGHLGEKRSLLQENLEKALKEGYTREYEELIRQYFELLSKEADY